MVRCFQELGLRFPRRSYGGAWNGKLLWGRLTHSRVLGILANPSYAGTYVFGRYQACKQIGPTGESALSPASCHRMIGASSFLGTIQAISPGINSRQPPTLGGEPDQLRSPHGTSPRGPLFVPGPVGLRHLRAPPGCALCRQWRPLPDHSATGGIGKLCRGRAA